MARGRVAIVLTALLWSFTQAPFDHFHAAEHHTDHPASSGSGFAHFHGGLANTGHGVRIGPISDDDDAIDLDWSIASPGVPHDFAPQLADRQVMPAPILAGWTRPSLALHSHDPPGLRAPVSRGPPA